MPTYAARTLTIKQHAILNALGAEPTHVLILADKLQTSANCIKVQICKMKKLGVKVECMAGKGYYVA